MLHLHGRPTRERLFHQILLFFGQVCGYLDYDFYQKIATVIGIAERHTQQAEAEQGITLGSPGYFQECTSGKGRHVNLATQEGDRQPDNGSCAEIRALSFEYRIIFHVDDRVKISRRPLVFPGFTFPGNSEELSVFDAAGDRNLNLPGFLQDAGAVTGLAGLFDNPATPPAFRAG